MRVARSILINRPVTDVFAFVADPLNDRIWCPKIEHVEPAPVDAGQTTTYRVRHRPVPLLPARDMAYTLVASEPPHLIRWHEDDGHDVIDVTYSLEARGTSTWFTQSDEARLGGPRVLHPIIKAGIGHDLAAQLKRLRRHLEDG
ncbi:SRPBCC family protein [Paraconexibacter antarcticus]|uniref:SRPBCC family protein n=1 Tax=Paraconexibacter antarcticus TaxID=2949664 RepID=A0ABY5DX83_9ACTN|nr:SRPBCC family protein [Paraconexibacter antarcticus]UTI65169.1 SRPBCC family protein [Paraconexibacter antarcticus]